MLLNKTHLQSDYQQLKREPIMLLFACLPILLIGVFSFIFYTGANILTTYTGFNLLDYANYMASMVYTLHALMLGTVIGFFMIDEKDARIFELLRITPLGLGGYLLNRLLLPVLLNLVYIILTYIALGVHIHKLVTLLPLSILTSAQLIGIGLFIAMISSDKVKGLTYAKATGVMIVFIFVDLLPIKAVQILGRCTPQYYIYSIINSTNLLNIVCGFIVTTVWLALIFRKAIHKL